MTMTQYSTSLSHVPIESVFSDDSLSRNITGQFHEHSKTAQYAEFPLDIDPRLVQALTQLEIGQLYSHQRSAYDAICSGKNTVISTGVASGKSLCYHLPILNDYLKHPDHRSLFLYPMKALGQDQREKLHRLLTSMGGNPSPDNAIGVYDGDTTVGKRSAIRQQVAFVLSNPDMLHIGILPHHTQWADFFTHLKYVVVDEVHVYRGIFGSHFANVIRRFKRIARFYGSNPVVIATSATIHNGLPFVETLFEEDFDLIDRDGSARGTRHFLIYNPPLVHRGLGIRKPAQEEAVRIAGHLLNTSSQTLVFAHTRKSVEMLVTQLQDKHKEAQPVFGYRSGYLPRERREIEDRFRRGDIRMVVGTSALELGIDIGGIDVVMMVGYPGSITSTHQQSGRAGRAGRSAYAILIASANLMDQYLVKHPDYLFYNNPEAALINPDNPYMLFHHLQCAAFEKPFADGESFGKLSRDKINEFFELLERIGKLHRSNQTFYWSSSAYPANSISLRTATADQFVLRTEDTVIGMVDRESTYWLVHPEAIYLHNGDPFIVTELNLKRKTALLSPIPLTYITYPQSQTEFELMELYRDEPILNGRKGFGQIRVENKVTGYKKIKYRTGELLGSETLDLPATQLVTHGCWITFSREMIEYLKSNDLWNNEVNRYGTHWKQISEQVRERDHHTCSGCGLRETEKAFDVHHIIPFKSFSRSEDAHRLSNLTTLCSTCHQTAEKQVRIQSGLGGLSYLIRHLAPLFAMCSSNDICVMADTNSALAQNSPALIMYDRVPGGIGLSEKLFAIHDMLLDKSLEVVRSCDCLDGCPACVGPVAENGVGAKELVAEILRLFCQ